MIALTPRNSLNSTLKFFIHFFLFYVLIGLPSSAFAQQLAFPDATGAGAYATGGREGTVYHVTNLNDSGYGSFRDAVSESNRIIVFDVSGTIELTSNLLIYSNRLTIAGQSAPEGGITITGKSVYFHDTKHVVVRYLRFRPDYDTTNIYDALNAINCTNFIVDHCSVSWGADECFSIIGNSSEVTVQNCLFGESRTGMLAGSSSEDYNANFSIIGNLWYNISHRFPNVTQKRTDIINNVVHNWFSRLSVTSSNDDAFVNEIGNYYNPGVNTQIPTSGPNYSANWLDIRFGEDQRIYTEGNVYPGFVEEGDNNWDLYLHRFDVYSGQYAGTQQWDPANLDFRVYTPHPILGESPNITTAAEAYSNVQQNAGANKYIDNYGNPQTKWDEVDNNYRTHVIENTSVTYDWPPTTVVNTEHYMTFHNSVTNTPIHTRPSDYDMDYDGMSDVWENENNLNPNDASDAYTLQPDGYTNLEYFLNGMTLGAVIDVDANAGDDEIICKGEFAVLTASGGTTYLWSTGETSATIEVAPSQTTTYTVTVSNASGSTDTDSVTVTVNDLPTVFAGQDQTITIGESVTLNGSGADTYTWNSGQTTSSITVSPTTTTTYTVTGSLNGCQDIDSVVVYVMSDNESVNVSISGGDITLCDGESTTLTATGGSTYLWNTGETSSSISVSPEETTTYSVTAFSASGNNQDSDSITVSVNDLPLTDAGDNVTIQQGEAVTLSASGANTYIWNNGQPTSNITVSPQSTTIYSVTGYSNGCEATDQVTVFVQNDNSNENVDADIGGGDFSICAGTMTTLVASGGYSYLWSTGETTSSINISPTETTTYTLTAYSESGNTQDQDSITVSVYGNIDLGDDIEICAGGTVTLTSSPGESYLWSTGETTQSIVVSPNVTTTYSVVLTERFCTSSDEITVIISDNLTVEAGSDVTIYQGESTILTATGGAASYLWSTGETSASITVSPNATTTYSVTGYSNGCEGTDEVTVNVQNETVVANAGDDVSICAGESTTLTATGGTAYLWNTGETSASIVVSPSLTTTYSVIAYGAIPANSDSDTIVVSVNSLPNVNAGNDVTIFQGETTTLTATGGASYLWNTGETSASISVNPNTTTTYTVIAYKGDCEASDEVTVTVQNEVVVANAGEDVSICNGETTMLTATGGTTYLWSTGETTENIIVSPEATTTYSVTAYGSIPTNSDTDAVMVTVNALPSVNAGSNVSIFQGENTTLTATGAQSYLWNTGETSSSITVNPNSTATYSVTGYSNGCEATDQVIVFVETDTSNETVNADIGGGDFSICAGTTTTLIASGGYSYIWSTGETTSSIVISPMETTTYILTAFSESGNIQDQDSIIVSVYGNADAGEDVSICSGNSVTLTASSGQSYLWSNGETTQSISVSPWTTTVYSVEVTEKYCVSSDEVTVSVNESLNVNAGSDVSIIQGNSTTLVATGADTYLWSTGETSASITVNPNDTTTYTVTGFSNGCEGTDDITVIVELEEEEEEEVVNADIGGGNFSICLGTTTTLVAFGGASYLWSNGATTNSITVTPSVTTTYTVTAYSASGNSQDQDSVTISVNDVQVDAGIDVSILQGQSTVLTASGASSYLWSTGETTQSISVSPSSTQTYSVTGVYKGCDDIDQVTVNVVSANISSVRIINQDLCKGADTILTASEGELYIWNTGETSRSISISPNANSEYSVIIYDALESREEIIRVSVLSCEDNTISSLDSELDNLVDLVIIQNPSSSILKVKIIGLDEAISKRITMIDMNGKLLYNDALGTLETEKSIDVSRYQIGVYAIRLTYGAKSIVKKAVIK